MIDKEVLQEEALAFDKQVEERIKNGFIPDLRRLRKVDWFYNNAWRDPEFVKIYVMPDIDFILDVAKKSRGKVIELGCGCGYLTLELARNGLDVIGVDISPKSIEIAKKFAKENPFKNTFGSLEYRCEDILSMKLGENEFDSIIFFGTLHHMPDIDSVLSKVHKALKNRGNLIAIEPIRENFTMQSAEFAGILRAVLPTWIPYDRKLQDLGNPKSWSGYVQQMFNEYVYGCEHMQSPHDNVVDSEEIILKAIRGYFQIKSIEHSTAFIDKLIGGLRGKNKYVIAKFLKFLDDDLIRRKLLPHTSVRIHAIKKVIV